MSDLYVSWSEYHRKIEDLAVKIDESQWKFDRIVCLARGGLRVGDTLSRIFDKPLAILAASSYRGAEGKVRGAIEFARDLTMVGDNLGSHILLVDDLVDSGISLAARYRLAQQSLRRGYSGNSDCCTLVQGLLCCKAGLLCRLFG